MAWVVGLASHSYELACVMKPIDATTRRIRAMVG